MASPSKMIKALDCGCVLNKTPKGDKWTFCHNAESLFKKWQSTSNIKDHDKYQKHFKTNNR